MKKKYLLFIPALLLVISCGNKDAAVTTGSAAQQQEAKGFLAGEKVVIKDETIQVPDRVFFGFNDAFLNKKSKENLNIVVEWLNKNPEKFIVVEGNCDERGTRDYNLALGKKRAEAVKAYLTTKGVKAKRVKTISNGKEKPDIIGQGEENWSKNRNGIIIIDTSKKVETKKTEVKKK